MMVHAFVLLRWISVSGSTFRASATASSSSRRKGISPVSFREMVCWLVWSVLANFACVMPARSARAFTFSATLCGAGLVVMCVIYTLNV